MTVMSVPDSKLKPVSLSASDVTCPASSASVSMPAVCNCATSASSALSLLASTSARSWLLNCTLTSAAPKSVPKPALAPPARREQLDGHVLAEHAARQQAAWQARQQELMVIGSNGLPAEVRARHGARGQVQARSTHPSTRAEPYDSRRVEPYDSRRVEPYDSRPDSSACNGSYCASVSDAAITAAEDIRRRGVDNKGSTKTYQREPPLVDRKQTVEGARQYASTHEAAGGMLWHGRLEGPPEKRSSAAIKQMVERDSPAPQPARVKDTSGVPRAVCYPTRGAPASIFR